MVTLSAGVFGQSQYIFEFAPVHQPANRMAVVTWRTDRHGHVMLQNNPVNGYYMLVPVTRGSGPGKAQLIDRLLPEPVPDVTFNVKSAS